MSFLLPSANSMKLNLARCLWGVLIGLFLAWSLTGCAWLDRTQRAAIYRPTPTIDDNFKGLEAGDEQLYLLLDEPNGLPLTRAPVAGPSGSPAPYLGVWWLPSAMPNAPTLLYFHGVFRNLTHNYPKIQALRQAGFNVLAVTYRGWPGASPALPSEQSIYVDAMRAFAELCRRQPDPHKRLLYGHSMGGGVAVEVASRLKYPDDYAGLMLESTFTTLADVATELRWYAWLLKPLQSQYFDSVSKIPNIKAPLLVRHGEADQTIPFVLGRRLFDAGPPGASPRRFIGFEGGSHSGLHVEFPERYRSTAWDFWLEIAAQIR